MTVEFMIKHPDFVDVVTDGTGEIEIGTQGGYYGEMEWRTFDAEELRNITEWADRHYRAYKAYTDSGYEDEAAYHKIMGTES
jgi:hypothetical protein